MTRLPWVWGARPDEVAAPFPSGDHVPHGRATVRAVDVDAGADVVFRWLCQLRVAPYSYDLVDNLGRPSPRTLTPGLDELGTGQRFGDHVPDQCVRARPGDHRRRPEPAVRTHRLHLPTGSSRTSPVAAG